MGEASERGRAAARRQQEGPPCEHRPASAKLDAILAASVSELELIVFEVAKGLPPAGATSHTQRQQGAKMRSGRCDCARVAPPPRRTARRSLRSVFVGGQRGV